MHNLKKYFFVALFLPIQVIFVLFISQKPQWIEFYYSNGIYPYISQFFRIILGWIPFSVGDIIGFVLLYLLLKSIYFLIKKRFQNFLPKLVKFIAILSIIYFCFYAFWGLNYFREPLAKNLELKQSSYTTEELISTTKQIVTELNKVHLQITKNDSVPVIVPYSQREIYKLAPNGFQELSKTYPQLTYQTSSIKSSLVSLFQSYNGTSGYLNPITGEAQVNNMIPKTGYPATTCHEMAHQIGWAAENDANFVSFLASIANKDLYFKYSGYRMAYNYCIGQVYKRDKALGKEIAKTVNKGVYKDYKATYLHWKQFKNPIEPYLKKGYNSYLKANNQSKGIQSYSYVVDLLIAYFKKKSS
ncbi:DUF3810 domain-containing protein [Tenacibaculum mesophilum]|uniref:DUF3810 domain-containing protein n=1 Tax=Tenacibaculum mesophilum TaxID=104268 RepID=UPI0006494A67|nr:DUF3810 domain-containing protein [Tenacibaculum mesophilum]GFD76364.1 hypothetical protein KUL113_57840 [Tenacibaculum sp. KUL113]GFD93075.1 hypothetical protein KUL154_18080 [Alteromonas sp. KUL154]GFE02505.1 hypothetical protein KUL156_50970 [Alteromonas sp. KUL156]